MKGNIIRAFVVTSSLAAICAATGCVADRPSRNGVFNENQYIRKDFLIRPGSGGKDPGWFLKSSIVSSSVPNPLGASDIGLAIGAHGGAGGYVNFNVTSDRLVMQNMLEPTPDQALAGTMPVTISSQGTRNQETIDSWPVTNVDLKYRVNLDGEKTNFYEENQELDWQQRQWIKLSFDKNDQSDFVTFGTFVTDFLNKCTDAVDIAATLHPDSFYVDEANNYWQFAVDVTVPISQGLDPQATASSDGTNTTSNDVYCQSQFGYEGWLFNQLGRSNVTFTVMYSFMRASEDARTSYNDGPTDQMTYMPMVVPEKDNIQRKYGGFYYRQPALDPASGLWGSRQLVIRFDPKAKVQTRYFAQGFPQKYKSIFGNPDQAGCTDACTYSGGGGGVIDQTNALFKAAGATTKLVFKDYDADLAAGQRPREYGDARYSMLRFRSDLDNGTTAQNSSPGSGSYIAVTNIGNIDPRTGQTLSLDIDMNDTGWQDLILARLDYYEQSIGAFNFADAGQNGVPATCQDGDTIPLVPATVAANHNGTSTLFGKMQQYMGKPLATWGPLGPSDFIVQHDSDFYNAFFHIMPYEVFGDPAANPYVIEQGGTLDYGTSGAQLAAGAGEADFQALMHQIDSGEAPFDVESDSAPGGGAAAAGFLNHLQQATLAHRDYEYVKNFAFPYRAADDTEMFSLPGAFQRDARHCINGKWETRDQYVASLIKSYYGFALWHEFGHSLALRHNFMGSVDRNNFPHYKDGAGRDHVGTYSASIMDYNVNADRVFWAGSSNKTLGGVAGAPGYGPYDQAAIAFFYANSSTSLTSADSGNPAGITGNSVSGQSGNALDGSGTAVTMANSRWKDPLGYCPSGGTNLAGNTCNAGDEVTFLYCTDENLKYTPFCRQKDFGTTPSEIMASAIDDYEWQYLWRNFPQYHQYFDFSSYANTPSTFFTDGRRFLSTWEFDWSGGQLADNFRKLGVVPPTGVPALTYYNGLQAQFNQDISVANQMYAATAEGMILQSSGQRPFTTKFDSYFGDTIQQGIIIDKTLSLQAFTALWPIDNYDRNQAQGLYESAFSFQADPQYQAVSEAASLAMVGGSYDSFAYDKPLGVQQFAMATHDTNFITYGTGGRPEIKDWIGGYVFYRESDFLDFFRNLAVINNTVDATGTPLCGAGNDTIAACQYDPTVKATADDVAQSYHSDNFNQFIGPDYRRWIWVYVRDMNRWIVADRDRNVATFIVLYTYTSDVLYGEDDGNTGAPYVIEYPIKYFLNNYQQYGN